jgi:hypothetical protein
MRGQDLKFGFCALLMISDLAWAANSIAVFDGDAQVAAVGEALARSLQVIVRDEMLRPVSNATIAWKIDMGDGRVTTPISSSDKRGVAVTHLRFGNRPGELKVRAYLAGTNFYASFNAASIPGAPAKLETIAQQGSTIRVAVRDGFGNPLSGVGVIWSVLGGGGELSAQMSSSDKTGVASADYHLNGRAGVHRIQAKLFEGEAVAVLTVRGKPGKPAIIEKIAAGQVVVRDANRNPISNVNVMWKSARGDWLQKLWQKFRPSKSVTDMAGIARVPAGLGPDVVASIGGVSVILRENQSARARVPTIEKLSGDQQIRPARTALDHPLKVLVRDENGRPIANATVDWFVEGGGILNAPTTITDDKGVAKIGLILGENLNRVRAQVRGAALSTWFSAQGISGARR